MEVNTIRSIVRPIINTIFIGVSASSFYLQNVEIPSWWIILTCASGAEWISERAITRYKELFGASLLEKLEKQKKNGS